MGKNRKSKRQLVRDEKRAKKRGREIAEDEERSAKRQRQHDDNDNDNDGEILGFTLDPNGTADFIPLEDNGEPLQPGDGRSKSRGGNFEREFFGMLADQEQEYFRHADEMLELNDFPSPDDRHLFLQSVYREARGKELKLASSQSCSRLMERLILLSSPSQKKRLFGAFAGHFMTLITHRFASHCCEKLFLLSAPVVTEELSGEAPATDGDVEMGEADGEQDSEEVSEAMKTPMEDLFLLTLDELEEHLSFLLSDRYGSHALRVLLLVLSGRPLNQAGTKSLLQGKNKEHITVEGASTNGLSFETRTVPLSFGTAIQKILGDSTANLDGTALRVLAKHPTGNPTLQLLLDLELSLSSKSKKGGQAKKLDEEKGTESEAGAVTLVERLVPGAPASFSDEKSPACEFVNSMLYDPIGSRLLETLIAHCPGKIFKALHANIFGPRIQSLLRNDIASYPAIKVLNRLSKEDLADAVQKTLPEIPSLVEKGRLNVIKTFFERCHVRNATAELTSLLQALTTACGGNWKHLVPRLCLPDDDSQPSAPKEGKEKTFQPPDAKNKAALLSHGSQLASTLLTIPGQPSKAIQASLLALSPAQLLRLATTSPATAAILTKSLSAPPQVAHFHKLLVAALLPNLYDLATTSAHSSAIVNAIIAVPSRAVSQDGAAPTAVVPFHLKENAMAQLERREADLRATWLGRSVWRAWRGDLWSHRRHDWVRWAKETDPEGERVAGVPGGRGKGREVGIGGGKDEGAGRGWIAGKGGKVSEVRNDAERGEEKGEDVVMKEQKDQEEGEEEGEVEQESKAQDVSGDSERKVKKEKKEKRKKEKERKKEPAEGDGAEGKVKKEKKKKDKEKKRKTEEEDAS